METEALAVDLITGVLIYELTFRRNAEKLFKAHGREAEHVWITAGIFTIVPTRMTTLLPGRGLGTKVAVRVKSRGDRPGERQRRRNDSRTERDEKMSEKH